MKRLRYKAVEQKIALLAVADDDTARKGK